MTPEEAERASSIGCGRCGGFEGCVACAAIRNFYRLRGEAMNDPKRVEVLVDGLTAIPGLAWLDDLVCNAPPPLATTTAAKKKRGRAKKKFDDVHLSLWSCGRPKDHDDDHASIEYFFDGRPKRVVQRWPLDAKKNERKP